MRHRFLVLGADTGADVAASFLGRAGHEAVVCRHATDAVAIARGAPSALVVVVAPPAARATADLVAALTLDPATQSMPVFVVYPEIDVSAAVTLLASGVAAVIRWAGRDSTLVDRVVDVVGPESGDAARVWAAIDQRGPAVLRRIARFFTDEGLTAMVAIEGAGAPALVSFVDGDFHSATYGTRTGAEAASALLSAGGPATWSFVVERDDARPLAASAPHPRLAPPPIPDDAMESDAVERGARAADDDDGLDFSVDDAAAVPLEPLPRPSADKLAALPPVSILLVDDDPDLVTLYTRALSSAGARVTSASDGEQGFRRALEVRPDVIVSDIMMPRIDGWGLLALVRADYRVRETPFVLFSCHGDYLAHLEKLSAGAEDYLAKGLRPSSLVERVLSVLDERRTLAASLAPGASFSGTLVRIGPATLLRALSTKAMTGTLTVTTRTGTFGFAFQGGHIVDARHAIGGVEDGGLDALRAFLALDDATFTFVSGAPAAGNTRLFFPDVEAELERGLNDERTTHDESELASDMPLVFAESERLSFYRTMCPDAARPVVGAPAAGTTPLGVLATSDASPLLVEAVVKDILRKGIARFEIAGPVPS